MQLNEEREKADEADDRVGVLHGAMPFGVVVLGDGEVTLNADGNEQRGREIDEVVGEEDVQFAREIAVQPHVLIGIETDEVEVQDAEEDVT